MATMIERARAQRYAFRPIDVMLAQRAFPAAGFGRLALRTRNVGGLGQFGKIDANPLVCAAIAGLVGAGAGFFGARGALKGKGMAKKKMQQQIAMYAAGATAISGVIGYLLCGKKEAPEPILEPSPRIVTGWRPPIEPPR